MTEIVMPRLSDSMEEGTILKWLKADGDDVARGEPLAEIETDKATLTYESDAAGVLTIVVAAGETLPIGSVIAKLEGAGGNGEEAAGQAAARDDAAAGHAAAPADAAAGHAATPADAAAGHAAARAEVAEAPAAAASSRPAAAPASSGNGASADMPQPPVAAQRATGRVKASPLARRMAREQGIDLHAVAGTGPGGRVVKADVEAAARTGAAQPTAPVPPPPVEPVAAPPAQPPTRAAPAPAEPPPPTQTAAATAKGDITVVKLSRVQQVIARRMAESKATVPEFTLRSELDMEACVVLRAQLKALGGDVPSYNDMVVKASALALREFPRVNGSYRDGAFELHSRVNVGVAVAATDALVVPTIFDADRKSLREIARESRALAERVRAATVTPPELSGGTFTVSNLGMYGVTDFTAVINPPQAAILAVGALAPRAVVRAGELVARHTMGVTLACDHRILYGADAAQFLARIRELLEQPLALAF
jgi:pyruvate dehydrogenase E2 component (dihydrolipoyllysine-residue acetyltransferase)